MDDFIEVADIRLVVGAQVKAFADLKIGGRIIIKGFKVLKGKKGLFVAVPRKAHNDGKWYDMLLCLNEEDMRTIEDKVLVEYDKARKSNL